MLSTLKDEGAGQGADYRCQRGDGGEWDRNLESRKKRTGVRIQGAK